MIWRKALLLFIICISTRFAIFADVGIELDEGMLFVNDDDISMYGPHSAIGFSITACLDKFVGIGFYSKLAFPQDISYSSETLRLGKDFDVWLIDLLLGPVFTLWRLQNENTKKTAVQLMFSVGPHMALLHLNVPAVPYRDYSSSRYYFKNYKGIGCNLTFQIYTATWYIHLRLQYSYDMYSGDMSPLRSIYPSFGVGLDPFQVEAKSLFKIRDVSRKNLTETGM
jgi:hypothetical protein